jgi:SAM-dependent methyltransferase
VHPEPSDVAASPKFLTSQSARGPKAISIYVSTVFLSAFLLFLIEPLFAKLILPWFGGSASVWATSLVFFQLALLLGYLYADLASRLLKPRAQAILHISLLLISLLWLPLHPSASWAPRLAEDPAWRIIRVLAGSIGLPFVLLSATSPLVQNWFSRAGSGSRAYRLFALSNLASLLGLLSYPFAIEPNSTARFQSAVWCVLFVLFALLCSAAAWISHDAREATMHAPEEYSGQEPPPSPRMKVMWFSLSACGSMLLLSITNHLSQNVAPVPLLWILPLALYLLTFTLAFEHHRFYSRWLFSRLLAVCLGAFGYAIYDYRFAQALQLGLPLFCGGLFVCCMFCHGELSRMKPHSQHLTQFYLMLSSGGAAGALFIGLIAPHIFVGIYELAVTLFITAVLALFVLWHEGWAARALWTTVAVAMAIVLFMHVRMYEAHSLVMTRNFYGALRVKESKENGRPARMLFHGTIEHGAQFTLPPMRGWPTTYYGPDSGIGLALRYCCQLSKRVGMVGLGAGTVASYGKPGDYYRFYDINPDVVRIANSVFTYLRESSAKIDVILGDARLSLQAEAPQNFDVLGVDAFSGDAIPVHLLTKESFAVYFRHLKPDGILAIHTSNAYLKLAPVVEQLADFYGYRAAAIESEADSEQLILRSEWVLVSRNQAFFENPILKRERGDIAIPGALRLWTDDYNNLFRILKPISLTRSSEDEQP